MWRDMENHAHKIELFLEEHPELKTFGSVHPLVNELVALLTETSALMHKHSDDIYAWQLEKLFHNEEPNG